MVCVCVCVCVVGRRRERENKWNSEKLSIFPFLPPLFPLRQRFGSGINLPKCYQIHKTKKDNWNGRRRLDSAVGYKEKQGPASDHYKLVKQLQGTAGLTVRKPLTWSSDEEKCQELCRGHQTHTMVRSKVWFQKKRDEMSRGIC